MQKITTVLAAGLLLAFVCSAVAMQNEEHGEMKHDKQAEMQNEMHAKMQNGQHMGMKHGEPAATQPASSQPDENAHAAMMTAISHAVAVMVPTEGSSVLGTVYFTQDGGSVTVHAELSGLEPGSTHAIHVHQFGDITGSNGKSAGGHYNPMGHDHGLPEQEARHAGDLGNFTADDQGNANYSITVDNLSIAGLHNPVIGRGVIVHAKVDDGGQPTGNAGARLAMGVIGIAKGE